MNNDTVFSALITIPANDLNFKAALARATSDQISIAIDIMKNRNGKDKTRIKACERELKNRGCTNIT